MYLNAFKLIFFIARFAIAKKYKKTYKILFKFGKDDIIE